MRYEGGLSSPYCWPRTPCCRRVVVALATGLWFWFTANHIITDNAYVDADLVQVTPLYGGPVAATDRVFFVSSFVFVLAAGAIWLAPKSKAGGGAASAAH
jgi:hypothetical protein